MNGVSFKIQWNKIALRASNKVSHSRFDQFNKYDGKEFSELLDAVQALYPAPETEFTEQAVNSLEQAESQINVAYSK
jgi:hypothetical protein